MRFRTFRDLAVEARGLSNPVSNKEIHLSYRDITELILSLGGIKFWIVAMYPFYIGWVIGSLNMVPSFNCVLGLIVIGPLLGTFTLLFNAYHDLSADRYNPRKRYTRFFEGHVESETMLKSSLMFCVIGILISVLISYTFAVLTLIIVVISVLYSHPKSRWKAVCGLDIFVNTIGIGVICPLAGWSLSRPLQEFPLWYLVSIATIIGGLYAPTTASDYETDRRFGIRTLAVRIGVKRTINLGLLLLSYGICLLLIYGFLGLFPLSKDIIFSLWPLLIIQPLIYYWMTLKPTQTNIWAMLTVVAVTQGLGTTIFLVKLTGW